GLHFHRIDLPHRRTGAGRYLQEYVSFLARAAFRATVLSLHHRYDVVQVDNLPDPLVLAGLPARWRGAWMVFFMYELMPELTAARLQVGERHPLVRLTRVVQRMALACADHVVVVTHPTRRFLVQRGVDAAKLSVVPNTQASAEPMPITAPAAPELIILSTLIDRYGVDVAIRATAELVRDWPDLTLHVCGAGHRRGDLEALAAHLGIGSRVVFHGHIPWDAAMARLRRSTLGIVPVVDDGYASWLLPNKLLEYVSHGVPAVCSRMSTVREYFDEDAVTYFEPGDARDLAAAVSRLLRDPARQASQVERARRAYQTLSWENVSPRYRAALGVGAQDDPA
ncbi:MAG: glycosyltransferase, partial [Candidatus Dormibacteria bacterium]